MDDSREHAQGCAGIRRVTRKGALALLTVGVLLLFLTVGIQIFTVPSASMFPTLLPGDSVLVNRLIYLLHPPRRGDIIAFRFPQASGREFVKRVIGLPGDVVKEDQGRFYVNGMLLAQAQTITPDDNLARAMSQISRRVRVGGLYVLGDNPETSLDSRFWGTVDEQEVVGEAVFIGWSRGKHWWQVRWDRIGRRLR